MGLARLDRPVTLSGPEIARNWIHASDVGAGMAIAAISEDCRSAG